MGLSAQVSEDEKYFPVKSEIIVFPNPAENTVHILGLADSNKAAIVITNVLGEVVLKHHWEIRNNALSIPIPNLKPGIYMLTINSREQQIKTKFYKK
jgi:hypothetical protein